MTEIIEAPILNGTTASGDESTVAYRRFTSIESDPSSEGEHIPAVSEKYESLDYEIVENDLYKKSQTSSKYLVRFRFKAESAHILIVIPPIIYGIKLLNFRQTKKNGCKIGVQT